MGHYERSHVTSFKTRNEPKEKLFEFGALQNKMHMASRENYIFHMLFGAFHDTPGANNYCQGLEEIIFKDNLRWDKENTNMNIHVYSPTYYLSNIGVSQELHIGSILLRARIELISLCVDLIVLPDWMP